MNKVKIGSFIFLLICCPIWYGIIFYAFSSKPFEFNDTPLIKSIKENDWQSFNKLIKTEDLEMRGEWHTPLTVAIKSGNYDFVEQLLKAGANPNSQKEPSVCIVTSFANYIVENHNDSKLPVSIINLLFEYDADIHTANICSSIGYAITFSDLSVAKALIAHGADVNSTNYYNDPPLNSAIISMHYPEKPRTVEGVKLLIESGANPYLKQKYGKTAIELAEDFSNPQLLRLLKQSNSQATLKVHAFSGISMRADALQDKLYQYGISVSAEKIQLFLELLLLWLFLPVVLACLIGVIIDDSRVIIFGLAQSVVIIIIIFASSGS